MSATQYKMINH